MSHPRYIDFISAYCDRWCERCGFTDRCSAFAVQCAVAMCDSVEDAVELAVGRAPGEDDDSDGEDESVWADDLPNCEPTEQERRALSRELEARRAHVDGTTIMKVAHAYGMLAYQWLRAHAEGLHQDAAMVDAVEVMTHDHLLIAAKLHRALSGRYDRAQGDAEDHPVQNDANGSAKVALISIARSAAAWRTVANRSDSAAMFADQLRQLQAEVETEFPYARLFTRPGFDDSPADS
jgi:hypothetical protein